MRRPRFRICGQPVKRLHHPHPPFACSIRHSRRFVYGAKPYLIIFPRLIPPAPVALKRFFAPEEVVHGIAWLANPANTTQVGRCLDLDGGVVHV